MKLSLGIFFLCHLLSWNRAAAAEKALDNELVNLYKSNTTSLSPPSTLQFDSRKGMIFTEGGAIKDNTESSAANTTAGTLTDKKLVGFDLLLSNVVAAGGTSSVKPRKGVQTIVPRKGVSPCADSSNATENGACLPPLSSAVELGNAKEEKDESESTLAVLPAVNESPEESPVLSAIAAVPSNTETITKSSLKQATQVKVTNSTYIPIKPTITVVPEESEDILKALKNERNVVIPVVALVCTPIVVLLILFVHKRYQESRENTHYERMGFLIEDIYND